MKTIYMVSKMAWKNYLKVTMEMGLENYRVINSQLKQGSANSFCKGTDNKYFRLLFRLYCNYSALLL